MENLNLYDKDQALKRIEYVKNLNYTDQEYKKNIMKHMFKYKDNARGLLNSKLPAQQELFMFDNYGFDNLKTYTLDTLSQNVEYCTVLECDSHEKQITKVIEYLELRNNEDYIRTLKIFSTKNGYNWYIPVDRLINWIDCYMIQKEVFFEFGAGDNPLLFVPHYFTDNVLLMIVNTDNEEEDFDKDLPGILEVYNKLVNGIISILGNLPEDRMIDNLFELTVEEVNNNALKIENLKKEYESFIEKKE